MGAMGWSYGGYMMNWLLGHTDRFKALASMMGIYDLASFYGATEELWFPEWDLGGTPWDSAETYRSASPSSYAERFNTPTLVISGERTTACPTPRACSSSPPCAGSGVPARLIVLPNDGHWPSWVKSMPLYYAAHLDWFHRYLGGGPRPTTLKRWCGGGPSVRRRSNDPLILERPAPRRYTPCSDGQRSKNSSPVALRPGRWVQ